MKNLSRVAAAAALVLGLGTVAQAQSTWTYRHAPAVDNLDLATGRSVYAEPAPRASVEATQRVMGLSVPNGAAPAFR